MTIRNHTRYDTKAIRRLIVRIAKDELNPGQLKLTRWTVDHYRAKGSRDGFRQARLQGDATRRIAARNAGLKYNHGVLRINAKHPYPAHLAMLIAHEMAEMRGLDHDQMRQSRYGYATRRNGEGRQWDTFYAWANEPEWAIEPKAKPRPKTTEEKRARRLTHAQRKVERWERRLKLATTMVKKWRRTARRLESIVRKDVRTEPAGVDAGNPSEVKHAV